jgi:AmmeMemoRadiSam system protein B
MINETLLFDSLSSPVPEIRRDLQVIPVKNNGRQLLYFHDSMGYAAPNFAIDRKAEPLLSLITGRYSISQIIGLLNESIEPFDLLEFIQMLDENRILNTRHYRLFSSRMEKDFEASDERKPALAGSSYPDDPEKLTEFINTILSESSTEKQAQKALYAPHIDLRVGSKQYADAFMAIRHLQPRRVVLIGTSHYAGLHPELYENKPFIGSTKQFSVPGHRFASDSEYIDQLNELDCFTLSDRAHRIEHSLETHLMFISRVWNHEFSIVPILVSGFDELFYHSEGFLASSVNLFTEKLKDLDSEDTFYLISGDLSHVGKKFGDSEAANDLREKVEDFDQRFIEYAVRNDSQGILDLLSVEYDSTRICGYPPLFTFLKAFPALKGTYLNYHWWDESERESAVSFGSIAY